MIEELTNDAWRALLQTCAAPIEASSDEARREEERSRNRMVRDTLRGAAWNGAFQLDASNAYHVARICMSETLPASRDGWDDVGHHILSELWRFRHPVLTRAVLDGYAGASRRRRGAAIVLLVIQGTSEAAEGLGRLVREHGLPALYPRFTTEFRRHLEVMAPALATLLAHAGSQMTTICDLLIAAGDAGHIDLADPAVAGQGAALEARALKLLEAAAAQEAQGLSVGESSEDDEALRHELGALIDLLGRLPGSGARVIEGAIELRDPHLTLCTVSALLAQGDRPPAALLERAAASAGTRAQLHGILHARKLGHLFPDAWRTFERLAETHMVSWLMYPTELGYAPPEIALGARVEGRSQEGDAEQWLLWRFCDEEGQAFAGFTGPYPADCAAEQVLQISVEAFSSFEPWASKTPEQHVESMLDTLESWTIARCDAPG